MPRFDLRQDEESLKPLAAFQVLAVMCRPMDRIKRERMMGDIEATSGMAAPRRRPFSSEEFRREVRLSALKAGVAGGLLLTRLQLHLNGYRFSLARAMPLAKALLPAWELQYGGTWPKDASTRQWPHSRRKMLGAYEEYRSADELVKALHENLKLRRELATEVAGANGEKLAAVRYRSTRLFGSFRHAFSRRIGRASMSAAVVGLMTVDGAREQYAAQLRQLDRQALLKEIEHLRRLLTDLPPPRTP